MMLMEHGGLIEKHARAAGVDALKVNWIKVGGPAVMNDGLISGAMHFVAQGAPSLITLWDKTRDGIGVKGVSAMTTYPLYLVTRNPEVKSIQDFALRKAPLGVSGQPRIAAARVQPQAEIDALGFQGGREMVEPRDGVRGDLAVFAQQHPAAVEALQSDRVEA